MSTWHEAMKEVKEVKRTIYQAPLPLKRQRVTAKSERPGKVKVFTRREIWLINLKRRGVKI